jgi:soluble lytic murein transglycosylase-like protein
MPPLVGSRPAAPARRGALRAGLWAAWWLSGTATVRASPAEASLSDAVRHALRAAVEAAAPPTPVWVSAAAHEAYLAWLDALGPRLQRHKPDPLERTEFLQTVWYESRRAGLDESLVLGVIQVESGFRRYAISSVGARGYMQVMPFWARLIGDGDPSKLFHLQTNLRFGCVILRHYLDTEQGNTFMALGRYNGSRGRSAYPEAVWAAQRQWRSA